MGFTEGLGLRDSSLGVKNAGEPSARAVGSPLPVGAGGRVSRPVQDDVRPSAPPPPPGRSLVNPAPAASQREQPSGFLRAAGALRWALPFVQRVLPLLDGNLATAVSSILGPRTQASAPAKPVDLAPIEEGLTELRTQQRDLRNQVAEQNSSLKRVEDQLEMVREATDRNTLEQQELLEDLKAVGRKVKVISIVVLGLLAVSILLNVLLLLHIQRVLP